MSDTAPVREASDFGAGDRGVVARWIAEIRESEKDREEWVKRGRKIEKRYRDDRDEGKGPPRFNVLWSNVQTLMPACYARPPQPVVGRRYRDSDPVARAAALILQRNLQEGIEAAGLHETVKQCVLDLLVPGMGQVWLRYKAFMTKEAKKEQNQLSDEPLADEKRDERVGWETVEVDYVHWEDFLFSPARTWAEVRWVGRRVRMTREDGVKRFGSIFEDVPLDWRPDGVSEQPENQIFSRAVVVEVWSIEDRMVRWIAPSFGQEVLDEQPDPLRLEKFWPCPKPLFATQTNSTLIPVPDYSEYQDQAIELDRLTDRIDAITTAVRVAGVYDESQPALGRLFGESGKDNDLIAVANWQALQSKGGLNKAFELVDTAQMTTILQALNEVRTVSKNDLYELTGIADIIRGASDPEDTATAQRIKGRYATMRLSDRQQEIARFVRDILRLMAEVMCEHYGTVTLVLASNFTESELWKDAMPDAAAQPQAPPPPQPPRLPPPGMPPAGPQMAPQGGVVPFRPPMPAQAQPPPQPAPAPPPGMSPRELLIGAIGLLKSDRLRGFKVDIEDQSTIAADDMEEKQSRTEFLGAVGSFLQQASQIAPQFAPAMLPVLGKMLLFGMRAYRAGTEMETAMEEAVAKMQATAAQPQPAPPDPKMIEAAATARLRNAQADQIGQQGQIKMAEMQQTTQQNAAQNHQDLQQHGIDMARLQLDGHAQQMDAHRAQMEDSEQRQKFAIQMQELRIKQQELEIEKLRLEHDSALRSRQIDVAEIAAKRPQGQAA